jgi:thiaminase
MANIFNIEEESRLHGIINDYRTIYDQASFLAIQMEKMENEMSELLKKMEDLKNEETEIYNSASERTAIDLEEIKKKATELVLKSKENTSPIIEN